MTEQVTTIADTTDLSKYWAERQRIADEKQEALVNHVASMLRDFLKETQDPKIWDNPRASRAEVCAFMRDWARKIVREVRK